MMKSRTHGLVRYANTRILFMKMYVEAVEP